MCNSRMFLFCLLMIGLTIWQVVVSSLAFANFIQLFSIFSIAFLLVYNNEKGEYKLKYLFYVSYPVHLMLFYLIILII